MLLEYWVMNVESRSKYSVVVKWLWCDRRISQECGAFVCRSIKTIRSSVFLFWFDFIRMSQKANISVAFCWVIATIVISLNKLFWECGFLHVLTVFFSFSRCSLLDEIANVNRDFILKMRNHNLKYFIWKVEEKSLKPIGWWMLRFIQENLKSPITLRLNLFLFQENRLLASKSFETEVFP